MKIGMGRHHSAAIIVALLASPWAISFILTEAGIRFDVATLLGEPPPRLPVTAPSSDQYDPPPTWREHKYLAANPDVAAAVAAGAFSSGYEHYARIGQSEGRAFPSGESKKTKPPAASPPAPAPAPAPIADPPAPPAPLHIAERPAEKPAETTPPPEPKPAATMPAPPPVVPSPSPPPAAVEPPAREPPPVRGPEKVKAPEPPPAPGPAPRKPPPPEPPAAPPVVPPVVPPTAALAPPAQQPQRTTTAPTATDAAATVLDLRFGRHADFTRLVLDLTDRVDFKIESAPDRRAMTIRLHNARWSAPPRRAGLQGLIVTGYEASPAGASEVRLTLQTAGPAVVVRANLLLPSEGRGHRLMIDLAAR